MKYVYTATGCPKCVELKKSYTDKKIKFIERSSNRLKTPEPNYDKLDEEAFAVLCEQHMNLPVIVDDGKE